MDNAKLTFMAASYLEAEEYDYVQSGLYEGLAPYQVAHKMVNEILGRK